MVCIQEGQVIAVNVGKSFLHLVGVLFLRNRPNEMLGTESNCGERENFVGAVELGT